MPRRNKHRIRWHSMYLWHRYMGLTAALFVVILAVTGLTLNHTEALGLDSRMIKSSTLLDWYGITPPRDPVSFTVADHWISQLGQRLYFDEQEIQDVSGRLIGVARLDDIVVIALQEQLLLTTLTGQLIESLGSAEGVPAGMQAITSYDNSLLVLAAHGTYITDGDFIEWQEFSAPAVNWSGPTDIPASLYQRVAPAYLGSVLSMERVILDIHSGRILGPWGFYIIDAAAVLFILLAAAGIWLWARRYR